MWKCAHDKFPTQTNLVCHCRDGATDFFPSKRLADDASSSTQQRSLSEWTKRREKENSMLRSLCAMFLFWFFGRRRIENEHIKCQSVRAFASDRSHDVCRPPRLESCSCGSCAGVISLSYYFRYRSSSHRMNDTNDLYFIIYASGRRLHENEALVEKCNFCRFVIRPDTLDIRIGLL